jgi:hypothetical protein
MNALADVFRFDRRGSDVTYYLTYGAVFAGIGYFAAPAFLELPKDSGMALGLVLSVPFSYYLLNSEDSGRKANQNKNKTSPTDFVSGKMFR